MHLFSLYIQIHLGVLISGYWIRGFEIRDIHFPQNIYSEYLIRENVRERDWTSTRKKA